MTTVNTKAFSTLYSMPDEMYKAGVEVGKTEEALKLIKLRCCYNFPMPQKAKETISKRIKLTIRVRLALKELLSHSTEEEMEKFQLLESRLLEKLLKISEYGFQLSKYYEAFERVCGEDLSQEVYDTIEQLPEWREWTEIKSAYFKDLSVLVE